MSIVISTVTELFMLMVKTRVSWNLEFPFCRQCRYYKIMFVLIWTTPIFNKISSIFFLIGKRISPAAFTAIFHDGISQADCALYHWYTKSRELKFLLRITSLQIWLAVLLVKLIYYSTSWVNCMTVIQELGAGVVYWSKTVKVNIEELHYLLQTNQAVYWQ